MGGGGFKKNFLARPRIVYNSIHENAILQISMFHSSGVIMEKALDEAKVKCSCSNQELTLLVTTYYPSSKTGD